MTQEADTESGCHVLAHDISVEHDCWYRGRRRLWPIVGCWHEVVVVKIQEEMWSHDSYATNDLAMHQPKPAILPRRPFAPMFRYSLQRLQIRDSLLHRMRRKRRIHNSIRPHPTEPRPFLRRTITPRPSRRIHRTPLKPRIERPSHQPPPRIWLRPIRTRNTLVHPHPCIHRRRLRVPRKRLRIRLPRSDVPTPFRHPPHLP